MGAWAHGMCGQGMCVAPEGRDRAGLWLAHLVCLGVWVHGRMVAKGAWERGRVGCLGVGD